MAIDSVLQDLRLALRRLAQTPAFTTVTIATLALAIGANTTTFSALNQFLLRPLPVERPKELVFLNRGRDGVTQSYPNYLAFRDRNRTFDGLIAGRIQPVGLSYGDKNSYIWGYEATGNYFNVLGIRALIGRTLTPEDDRRSSPNPVLVISYQAWQNRFAADPSIVGKKVKLNGLDYTVVGVAPQGFFGTELLLSPEFWVPMAMEPQIEPGNNWLDRDGTQNIWVAGRLKPGVTWQQAEADLNSIAADRARTDRFSEGLRIHLSPPGLIGAALRGPVVGFASVLMAVAGLVLLIACVNIAGMLLARAADRRREISIRLALGAPRWTLIRQLLTESLVLSIAGAVTGILIASWILGVLGAFRMPINLPANTTLPLDSRVLLFTILLCLLTTLLFGLAPAVQSARVDLLPALKNQVSEKFRRLQPRDLLVGAQVALSLILLVGTVLVVRSLQQAVTIDIGFNPRHAVAVAFDVSLNGYSEDRAKALEQPLLDRLAMLPGIESIALSNWLPLGIGQSNTIVYAEGKPVPPVNQAPHAYFYNITPGYFRTMQTRLFAGRDFDDRDRPGSTHVAVVNQALAHRLFPNENALGKRFRQGPNSSDWIQIVGIVQDGKYQSLNDESEPALFWPRAQRYSSFTTIVARSTLPVEDLVRRLQQTVLSLDPTLPFFQAGSLEEHLNLPLMPARIAAIMLGAFGVLAVILAATGVYGMLAYAISRRTREIGIRVAIGASKANVLSLVLRRALLIIGCASAVGIALALAVGRFFAPVLYGISPKDPETYVLALALMGAIGLIACYIPARRALRIEAAAALREE
jgi:predicted permease